MRPPLYHVCCRDCTAVEMVVEDETGAAAVAETHAWHTEHDVDYGRIA